MRDVILTSLMITSFIFMMMLVIEYLNVLSQGSWQNLLRSNRFSQYLFGAVLGSIPGCLGAFAAVSLYSHGSITLGALVTVMIATSGDEAFYMLATVPSTFVLLTTLLIVIGIAAGFLTDLLVTRRGSHRSHACDELVIHETESCVCYSRGAFARNLKHLTPSRGMLLTTLVIILVLLTVGIIGPKTWNWVRVTLLLVSVAGLFIVTTVPEHFLEAHLWNHVAKKHIPTVFIWTFGTLLAIQILQHIVELETMVHEGRLLILIAAVIVGVIPESGPHLLFVTMYTQGMLPFSILMANSIVQDGHGMLPLLAHSRKDFVAIKGINLGTGFLIGVIGYFMGW